MSNCCTECFLDEYLKECIKEEGENLGDCSFCGSKNVYVIEPGELQDQFNPLINLYTAQVEFYPVDLLKECEGRWIWEILAEDWDVFDDWEVGQKIIEDMYRVGQGDDPLFLDNYVDREDVWYGMDQKFSDKLKKQWNEFCEEIAHRNRFFPQNKRIIKLLPDILGFSKRIITAGEFLFRARSTQDKKKLSPEKMGKPPTEGAIEGRANPQGISYLYLASNSDTAISEKRPQLKDRITVGEFKINDELQVVDLINPQIGTPFKWGEDLDFVLKSQGFLIMLGFILSKPVDRNKTSLEYLPTQYLCEFIKDQGFDGVLYNSLLGDGYNIVLFDETKTECVSTKLHEITSIRIENAEVVEQ